MADTSADALLVAHGIGWALLHTLWVGAIVGLLCVVGLRLLRRTSPRSRYFLCCASLVVLLILPVYLGLDLTRSFLGHSAWVERQAERLRSGEEVVASTATVRLGSSGLRAQVEAAHDEMMEPWISGEAAERVGGLLALFAVLWILASGFYLVRVAWRWRAVRRIPLVGTAEPSERWLAALTHLKARMRIQRSIRLRVSQTIDTPAVIGWARPSIVLPRRIHDHLAEVDREAVLAHELAHVRRQDFPANLALIAACCLLFYQPIAWWLLRRIEEEREFCTDDMACRFFGGTRQEYGRLLARLELDRAAPVSLVPAASGSSLMRRIGRLIRENRRRSRGLALKHAGALLLLAAMAAAPALASRSPPIHASAMAVMKHDLQTWRAPLQGGKP